MEAYTDITLQDRAWAEWKGVETDHEQGDEDMRQSMHPQELLGQKALRRHVAVVLDFNKPSDYPHEFYGFGD